LIVVEGYMDVIALHQAGFVNTVATLGTAFTERQMEQLWLLQPEPIICFDGDRAGEAAAARAIDRMLPMLREGQSFRFAFLPEGFDPDDIVRSQGAAAFSQCLRAARPLIDVLWLRERAEQPLDTPERRAAFEARLDALLGQIANARVRGHYRREVRNRLFALWRGQPVPRQNGARPTAAPTRSEAVPPPSPRGFATAITLALVNHPYLLDRFAEEVASLEFRDKRLAALLDFVTRTIFDRDGIARDQVLDALNTSPHAKLFARLSRESAFTRICFLQPETERADVEAQFADLIYRFRALPALSKELAEGADHLAELSEAEFDRFAALQQQVASVGNEHAADDAGDREAGERLKEKIAQVMREKATWRRGHRPQRRD
jgi:DNA primase